MASSRNILIFIEVFKQYYRDYIGKEYTHSLHDINILQGLSISKDSNFWHGKRLYQSLIDEYFSKTRPQYSIDHLFKLRKKGLMGINAEGKSNEEDFPFECESYNFIPISQYNKVELASRVKQKQEDNWSMEVGIVAFFIFLKKKLSRTADRFFRWVMVEKGQPLGIFNLFVIGDLGTLLIYRHSTMNDMLTGILLIEHQAFSQLGCKEVENLILVPSQLGDEFNKINLKKDGIVAELKMKGSQYNVVKVIRKCEDFKFSQKELLGKFSSANPHPMVSLARGDKIQIME